MLKDMTLDNKNSFFAITLASIGDGVIATNINGEIIFFNTAAEEITGWSVNEVKNKKIYEIFMLIDITTNQIIESPINQVLRLGTQMGLKENSALITNNGEHKFISASVSPIKEDTGIVSGTVTVFRDITRIRSTEIRSKEEKTNFIKLFNFAPVGVIVVDEKEEITYVNDTALGFLNSDREQSMGKKFGDAFLCKESFVSEQGCQYANKCKNCEIKKATSLAIKAEISTTNIELSKTLIINNKEVEYWLKTSVTSMFEKDKKSAILVLTNITDRKNKEIEVLRSRDFYLKIFENFPSMIWRTDISGKITYMDKNWSRFTGKLEETSLGFKWLNFLHQDDREKCYEIQTAAFIKRQPYDVEYRMLHSSGQYRWIQAMNRPFYDINGNFDGYIGNGVDITDAKIAEEGLKRYKILFEKVRDIILFLDIEGNIIDVNQSALKSYGYTYDEFLKLNIRSLREEGEITQELLYKFYRQGIFTEAVHYRKDGSSFPVEISSQGADIGGKRVIVIIIRDITERKVEENTLKITKEAAETANKTKSEFLANMSHEIRTPLNGIVGMVDLTLLTELDDEQKENLIIAKSCVNALLKVINDILDFSKMEAGKLVIEKVNFDIKSLIEKIIKVHLPHAIEKAIKLDYVFSSNIPQYLIGDPNRFQQILNNLISNAIKFTESGNVLVKIKSMNTIDNKIEIQFTVEDSGIGISEENVGRIFESFEQVDGSFTRRFGGTGLGLAISKQLSENMGGKLWVESKLGVGSKFYFNIKFEIGNKIEIPQVTTHQVKKLNKLCRVLIAEDSKVNQMVITRILEDQGYSVDIANNGVEAVKLSEKNSYDMILMDIQMPEMDGIEATNRIREKNKKIPIIAITAYALKGDREKFLAQGMNEYVSKPINVEELFSAIDKCMIIDNEESDLLDVSICIDESGEYVLKTKKAQSLDTAELSILNELSLSIRLLNEASAINKIDSIEMLAHKIKTLSNDIGIEELKHTAFKIELAARRGNFEEAIKKAEEVNNIFEVFKKSVL